MRVEIRSLQQRLGMTMIYVTHDQTEAMTMADQVILMRGGRIEQAGAPAQLYNRPETTFVASFIGAPPMNLLQEGALRRGIRPSMSGLARAGWRSTPLRSGRDRRVSGRRHDRVTDDR